MTERDEWNRKIVEEFRANDGEVGGPFAGVPLLLLHHRGVGTETMAARARVTEGEERDRIWSLQKAEFPAFAEYEGKTSRQIPVVVLEPTQAGSSSSTS